MKKQAAAQIKLDRKAFIQKSANIDSTYALEKKPFAAGSYGSVHLGTHKITKEKRVVKVIPKFKLTNVADFLNEVETMRLVVIFCALAYFIGPPEYNPVV